jgi:hypothetical protein
MTSTSISVPSRQDLIMNSVNEFFLNNKDHLNQMLPILNQTAHISLRILDYFVTNYAKKKKIIYRVRDGAYFNVFQNYKNQLKAYSKKQFDPFCRKMRKVNGKKIDESIKFEYDDKKSIETTVGQLNFFKWAIQYGVIAYIVDHLTDIVEDMILSTKEKKLESKDKKHSKKSSLGKLPKTSGVYSSPQKSEITATKTIVPSKKKVKVTISFR